MEYSVDLDKASIDALGDMIKSVGVKEEELTATENKTYNAPSGKAYNPVIVNVPNPSTGTLNITSNDTYDVTDYASVDVNVPNPSTGTLNITSNDTYDVTDYASVDVNVPNPSTGTLNITDNGTYDVTQYAGVSVDVTGWLYLSEANVEYTFNESDVDFITSAEEDVA